MELTRYEYFLMSNQMKYHVLLTFEKNKELFNVRYLRNKSMLEMKYTLKIKVLKMKLRSA